jgi:hypothetical protein
MMAARLPHFDAAMSKRRAKALQKWSQAARFHATFVTVSRGWWEAAGEAALSSRTCTPVARLLRF